jgi:hypothetical protein
MSGHVLTQYSKKHVLKAKHILAHIGNLTKKPTTGDKIELLGSQKVGPESKQPRVTWLRHIALPFGMGKCWSQHVLLHL